ncbi:hypothetical protein D3C84_1251340 [compost metagenome]
MGQHQVQLRGGVAQGLRNAAGAVVAEHLRGDRQGELLAQFDGLRRAQGEQAEARQGYGFDCVHGDFLVVIG